MLITPRGGKMLTVKNKFIFYIAFILLSGFLISSSLSYYFAKASLNDKSLNEILPLINHSIYTEIQNELMIPIHTTSLMAQDNFVIDWVVSGEENPQMIHNYLMRIKEKFNYSNAFLISNSTLNYYRHDGILKKITASNKHDAWYYNFIKLNRAYDLDVDTDEGADEDITIFINHRLENEKGELIGVIGAGLLLHELGNKFQHYQDKFSRQIYMVDSSGLVQVHSDKNFIEQLNIKNINGISSIAEQLLSNKDNQKSYIYQNDNSKVMMSVHYFSDLDWFLIVEESESTALGEIKKALWTNTITGLLITIFIVFIIDILTKKYQNEIIKLSSIDELTGLYNRRQFIKYFNHIHALAKRQNLTQSLLMIDIDHFKKINDIYGHLAGDAVLKKISKTMSSYLREDDLIARWGGEEFVISLSPTNEEITLKTGQRILQAIENIEHSFEGQKVVCTVSIGVVINKSGEFDLNDMLSLADKALYQAKDSGRNNIQKAE